jgi:hypothetical protein
MPRAALAFAATVAVGVVALLLVGLVERRDEAFTLGVTQAGVAAAVEPEQRVCQGPIEATEAFDAIELRIGTYRGRGVPFDVAVVAPEGSPRYGVGRQGGDYADNDLLTVPIGHVQQGARFSVCLTNTGDRRLAVYGNAAVANAASAAYLGRTQLPSDLSIVFLRDERRSLLSLASDMVDRMSLFHGAWVEPWLDWLLLALVLLAVPAVLALGLLRARP